MTYYVKSFDSDLTTKTLVGKRRAVCQTLQEVLRTKRLKPNTRSFGQKKRLSTTILHRNYLETYRPQGIVFTTASKPAYVLPFDLMLAAESDKILVHYYQMRDNLHLFYNHPLIPGYKKFVFKDIQSLVRRFRSPQAAWKAVNDFRAAHGQKRLPKAKSRLCSYNEAVFLKTVPIKPVAIFGSVVAAKSLARRFSVPYFRSAREFYKKT